MSKLYVNTIYPQSGATVALSGNLEVSGTLKAYQFDTIVEGSTTYLGSTSFGNDSADLHQYTGSLELTGSGITITGAQASAATLTFKADQGDDAADTATVSVADGGDFTVDCAADINLDADGGEVFFKDAGVQKGVLKMDTSNKFILSSSISTNDLYLMSGRDITLDATSDVNIPVNVGLTFGNDGEKIEGDGTDLTIASSAELDLTAGTTVDINASTTVTVDGTGISVDGTDDSNVTVTGSDKDLTLSVAGGSTQKLILSSAGTGANAIDVNATAGGVDIDANGAISLDSAAGSIDINVVDGQTVNVGLNGAVETIWSPHGTAGSELWSTINTDGTTDGAYASGSILLSSVAGGIGLRWADTKDLWAEGGQFVVTANHDTAGAIKLHADAGTGQTILIQNDAGTGTGAVNIAADAGGITLDAGGDIVLDADGADIFIKDGGTQMGVIYNASNEFALSSSVPTNDFQLISGRDIKFDADGGEIFFNDNEVQKGVLKMDTANSFILSSSVSTNDLYLMSGRDIALEADGGDVFITVADATAQGAGVGNADGVTSYVSKINGETVTTLLLDIDGLLATGTNKHVISDGGETTAAYFTKITTAINGVVYRAEMACVEAPTVGGGTLVEDLDLVANSQSVLGGAEAWDDATSSATYTKLIDAGAAWDDGLWRQSAAGADFADLADQYLYISAGATQGGSNSNVYTAGKFIIKLYGASF